jgi:hypothetical protein
MTIAEICQNGLNISTHFKNPLTDYDKKEIGVYKLSKMTGIHRTTIIKWAKEGKIKFRTAKNKFNDYCYIVDLLSFINYSMDNYRLNVFNSKAGRWWSENETGDGRTKNAIKIKKWRLKNAQRKLNS